MTFSTVTSRSVALNPLAVIDRIIADIELSQTQYDEAKTSYEAVGEVLNGSSSPIRIFTPQIFAQGSMRMGTTVRPVGKDHFDLDMVCWLAASGKTASPEAVYQWVWDALGAHETYRAMRQRKNRCIRLDYGQSRQYHLDVTPAVPDWASKSKLLFVPDRELKQWCSSHPIGFADDWFKKAAERLPDIRQIIMANARGYEALDRIEHLPEYGAFEKTPLQRIVQMLKHDRDEHFHNDVAHRPTSILITTITTHSYLDALRIRAGGLLEFVAKVIENLSDYIQVSGPIGARIYSVINPANPTENFAEKWTDEHHLRFQRWHSKVFTQFQELEQSKGLGVDKMLNRLSATFGNESVIKAANALGADARVLHESGKLRVDKLNGRVGSVGAAVAPTINFGNE